MRIYKNCLEAIDEIKRDVKEMGVEVKPQYQSLKVGEEFKTLEVQNYSYTIKNPTLSMYQLNIDKEWCKEEFKERISSDNKSAVNPGEAWKLRRDLWTPLLIHPKYSNGTKFSYTYNERMQFQLFWIIREIKRNPDSRQLFLSIWDRTTDIGRLGKYRVPCSLGYQFLIRDEQINITYMMRSSDVMTHLENDLWLAINLMKHVVKEVNKDSLTTYSFGDLTCFHTSLHAYYKDLEGIY